MELWTGLVCLVANPACQLFKRFGDVKGAYVNAVAWAESAKHFEGRVTLMVERQLDCIVREIEEVELLESALGRDDCPDEFFTMQATAERHPTDVLLGTLHVSTSGLKTMLTERLSVADRRASRSPWNLQELGEAASK
jgi:hypothetical protein